MYIIGWIVFGLIVGALARLFVPGPTDFRGCLPTVLLGIVGSVVGGFIGRALGMYRDQPIPRRRHFHVDPGCRAGALDLPRRVRAKANVKPEHWLTNQPYFDRRPNTALASRAP